ncbi:hypothetical protein K504DRAFT_502449 [Pleomassaria siparia CBS 279.74]|uniref:F-box domain-containing protein n=1 Tax=Pleomassaria siparia CBS 279.74 TaxID=1314801 RepID=A0A6G1KA89_9PLEO|nr:hypothetical protein K504DRAFT_502449 [Pleomassaria siparia CBS 279.74]
MEYMDWFQEPWGYPLSTSSSPPPPPPPSRPLTKSDPPPKSFPFLRFPCDIRLLVYEELPCCILRAWPEIPPGFKVHDKTCPMSIVRTCKLVNAEALPTIMRKMAFRKDEARLHIELLKNNMGGSLAHIFASGFTATIHVHWMVYDASSIMAMGDRVRKRVALSKSGQADVEVRVDMYPASKSYSHGMPGLSSSKCAMVLLNFLDCMEDVEVRFWDTKEQRLVQFEKYLGQVDDKVHIDETLLTMLGDAERREGVTNGRTLWEVVYAGRFEEEDNEIEDESEDESEDE